MTMNDDPFSSDADPYSPLHEPCARRTALKLISVAPVVATLVTGCAGRRLACVVPGEVRESHCAHRFCRYYSG